MENYSYVIAYLLNIVYLVDSANCMLETAETGMILKSVLVVFIFFPFIARVCQRFVACDRTMLTISNSPDSLLSTEPC